MFSGSKQPRCFALPPGCDFAASFIEGLKARLAGQSPEAMARVEIFVNTRRTERRLHALFLDGPAGFLPRIRVITDLSKDPLFAADLPTPVSPLRRRLELSQTIAALLEAEPDLGPKTAMYDLAESLADLMDEMQGEGVSPDVFAGLNVENHAAHWERSRKFLDILSGYFGDTSAPDTKARQRMAVEHLAQAWAKNPPDHPVIVAGSTGSRGTTALFMQAVLKLPQGAVVLPGYDFDLPGDVAKSLLDREVGADHPQTGMMKLITSLGLAAQDVGLWADTAPFQPARNKLVSLAMRPAPITDQWLAEGPRLKNIPDATAGLSLLSAPSQRQEATAIALCLRSAAEEGLTATLISPDRQLTRQVTAALERWHILPDDSGGRPLPLTPPGVLLRLVAELPSQRLTTETLLILLKHPLVHSSGSDRNRHLLRSRDLELDKIRGGSPFPDFDSFEAWAGARDNDPEAVVWAAWLKDCFTGVHDAAPLPLASHLQRHRDIVERLANGSNPDGESELWQKEAGIEAARVFAELEENADAGGVMSPAEYAALFRSVLNRGEVRDSLTPHPTITIWGTLEARVQGADLVILGGLNDGSWPKLPNPDPWLSRAMRQEAGLLLPERRIGLSAHDFQQAIAAKSVVLTRSLRDADAPTVASRWLIRLTNLLAGIGPEGRDALAGMEARGQYWLDLATELETPKVELAAENRPSPRPPVECRPEQLSVTQIKTLIRDPYAIYARKILKLSKLDPIRREPDPLVRGRALHSVLEEFIKTTLDGLPPNAAAHLLDLAGNIFEQDVPWPATRRLWLARLARIADWFVKDEASRRIRGTPVAFECRASMTMSEPPFTLTGTADRIDLDENGALIIYDYKTGAVPSKYQIIHFDKQLPLEGKMAEAGAFRDLEPAAVSALEYIGLGGSPKVHEIDISDDIINESWDGLRNLIRAYQSHDTGYTARARMEKRTDPSDYDHLSRRGEWEDRDTKVGEDVP